MTMRVIIARTAKDMQEVARKATRRNRQEDKFSFEDAIIRAYFEKMARNPHHARTVDSLVKQVTKTCQGMANGMEYRGK